MATTSEKERKNRALEGGSTAIVANEDKFFTSVQTVHVHRKYMYVLVHISTSTFGTPPACDTQDEGAGSAKGLPFPDALRFRLQGHITEPPVLYSSVLVQGSITACVHTYIIHTSSS